MVTVVDRGEMSVEEELLAPETEVTLANCDREPIHIPGAIQPHGMLLTLSEPEMTIRQASANVDRFLGRSAEELIGGSIDPVLDAESVAAIRELAARPLEDEVAVTTVQVREVEGASAYELFLHRSGGLLVGELEPRSSLEPVDRELLTDSGAGSVTGGIQQLFDRAASEVRQLTGYDRVMVYRFDDDGHGEVIGEARHPRLEPLLGHHYPASDIPRQARALYLRQMIRMIVDVDYQPVPLIPGENPVSGEPLDLGLATLRAVSPIHLQYLRNMGVTATLTISLIREGELWGMIACHHYSPHFVPYRMRAACRFIGELLSAQLASMEEFDLERERERLAVARTRVLDQIAAAGSLPTGLRAAAEPLFELLSADGVTVLTHEERISAGYVPEPGSEAEILTHVPPRRPLIIDRLSRELPAVSHDTELSGVLALPLPSSVGTYIVWYRDDWVRDLKWGGNPNASLRPDLTSMDLKTLTPRRSFETWRQTVVGQSRPWSAAQVEAASELVEALATAG